MQFRNLHLTNVLNNVQVSRSKFLLFEMPPTPGVGVGIDRSPSGLPPPRNDSNEVFLDECLILGELLKSL